MAQTVVTKFDADTKNLTSKVDKATGKAKKSIKGVDVATAKLGGAFKTLGATMIAAFGAQQILAQLTNMVRTFQDFEQGIANLKAVSQASGSQIVALTKDAQKLGATTKFTATEVASLQTELARLGFTSKEILQATEGVISLAAATGEGLAQSAATAGSTIRAFGLDASETQRVVDVMALSFSQSALDLSTFQESMKLVAPIAKAANIPVETTSALLGKLADAGLKGSIAGTSLKNLLSKLSDANSDLSKSLGFAVTDSESLFKALDILKDSNIDLTAATELTDERSKAAFLTLIDGADAVRELDGALQDAAGTADKMAKQQLDTLKGQTILLQSAFDGLQVALGKKLAPALRKAAKGLTEFISAITPAARGLVQSEEQLVKSQGKLIESTGKEIKQGDLLLISFDKLKKDGIDPNSDEQLKLNGIVKEAARLFGNSVVQIDKETGALKLNRGELAKQIKVRTILKSEAVQEAIAREVELTRLIDIAKNAEHQAAAISASVASVNESSIKKGQKFAIVYEDQVISKLARAAAKGTEELDKLTGVLPTGSLELVLIDQFNDLATAVDNLERNEKLLAGQTEIVNRLGIDRTLIFGAEEDAATGASDAVTVLTASEKALIELREQRKKDEVATSTDDLAKAEFKRIALLAAAQKKSLNEQNDIIEQSASFSEETNINKFDLLSEFYASDFDTFKEFEEAKRAEIAKTAALVISDTQKRTEAIQQGLQAASDIGAQLFDIVAVGREKDLANLEKQKEAELAIAGDNEEAREAIEKKFALKQKQLRIEEAEDQKAQAIFNAVLNTAMGITSALGLFPPNPVLAAIIAATGALQLAVITARPIPAFAEGTPFVQLNGNKKGRDTVPAMLSEGERVIPTNQNRKNWGLYNAIDKGNLESYILKNYVNPQLKSENLLGGSFAENIGKHISIHNKFHDKNIVGELKAIHRSLAGQPPPRFNPRKI